MENTLYYGDNLDILPRYVKDESVDLIYLDPPFNSNANYNVLFPEHGNGSKSVAQLQAFKDTWTWGEAAATYYEVVERGGKLSEVLQAFRQLVGEGGMLAYLSMMAPRLAQLHRVLKPTGSIYLHCDPTASHYLKLLMDAIFGPINFRSEVIWRRSSGHNKVTRQYGPIHDTLLFYAKTPTAYFRPGTRPPMGGYIRDWFTGEDERGPYRTNMLTGPGTRTGFSGKPWRGFDPTSVGRHWAIPRSLRGELPEEASSWDTQQTLDFLYDAGLIYIPRDGEGQPKYKQYIGGGVPYQDIWAYQPYTQGTVYGTDECVDEDVRWLEHDSEKLGYPTQKPVGLLARILVSSCPPEGLILDPFCGCGTAVVTGQKLGRRWIGIDITYAAVAVIKKRLHDIPGVQGTFKVIGEPTSLPDAQRLAKEDPYQFQWWALGLLHARPVEQKKGADHGIDGRLYFHDELTGPTKQIIFSVKAGSTGVSHVSELAHVVTREKAQIGVLICMQNPTGPMKAEAASAGFYASPWGNHPKIQLLTIADILQGKGIDYPKGAKVITFKDAPKAKGSATQALLELGH